MKAVGWGMAIPFPSSLSEDEDAESESEFAANHFDMFVDICDNWF